MANVRYRIVPAEISNEWNLQKKFWWWPFWLPVTVSGWPKKFVINKAKHLSSPPEEINV